MTVIPQIAHRAAATSALISTIRDPLAGEPGTEIRVYHNHATEYAVDLRNNGVGPVFRARNAAGTTMLEITQSGLSLGSLAAGSFGAPTVAWANPTLPTLGLYKGGTNHIAVSTGDPTKTFKFGAGTPSGALLEMIQTHATPNWGVYSVMGSFGVPLSAATGVLPAQPAIEAFVTAAMASTSVYGVKSSVYAASGSGGFAFGGSFQAHGGGTFTSGGDQVNSGIVGVFASANSEPDAVGVNQQILTAIQANCRSYHTNDAGHGIEIALANSTPYALGSAVAVTPAHRVWLLMGNENGSYSRRGTALDAFILMTRKRLNGTLKTVTNATNATPIVITTSAAHGYTTGNTVSVRSVGGNTAANGYWTVTVLTSTTFSLTGSVGNGAYTSGGTAIRDNLTDIQPIKHGIYLADGEPGAGTPENYPFDATSTFMASGQSGVFGGFIDLLNCYVDDGSGTLRGPILRMGNGTGTVPALDIQSVSDGGLVAHIGLGIAVDGTVPLAMSTVATHVARYTGTTANFTTTSVGAAGGASALPATPLGYLRKKIGTTLVLFPYYTNA